MAFRKKAVFILKLKPDILIIQECEHPDRLIFGDGIIKPSSILWFGENKNKGLGIFSFGDFNINLLNEYKSDYKTIIPVKVSNQEIEFNLFAIWANNPKDKDGAYITQVWKAIHHYEEIISNSRTILIGDFNSNVIWDKPKRIGNHSHLVEKLKSKQISSSYHLFHKQEDGKEKDPTLFMYRNPNKPYHIDYCFTSIDFTEKLKSVEVGNFNEWLKLSDHCPLIIDFN